MISQISLTMVSYLVHCGWIVPVLVLIGWSFERILITSRPQARFQVWAGLIILSTGLPLAFVQFPVVQPNQVTITTPVAGVVTPRTVMPPSALAADDLKLKPIHQSKTVELPQLVTFGLAGGYAVLVIWWLGRILVGLYQVRQFRKTLTPVELTDSLCQRLHHCAEQINVPTPLVFSGPAETSPFTFGIWRPVVVIPQTILESATPELLESVFAHELAHIRRRDFGVNLVLEFCTAFCGFHPLVWFLRKRLNLYREAACDEMVTEHLIDPLTFAQSLIVVADTLSNRHALTPGMFHSNTLEERIMSLTHSVDQTGNLKVSLFQRLSFGLVLSCGIGAFGLIPTLIPTLAETQSPQSPQGEPIILRQRSPAGVLKRTNTVDPDAEEAFHKKAKNYLQNEYEQEKAKKAPQLYFSYQLRRIDSTRAQVVCLMAAQSDSNWVEVKVEPGKMVIGPDGKMVIGENGLGLVNPDGSDGMIRSGSDSPEPESIITPVFPSITFAVQPDTDAVIISFKLKKDEEPTKLIMRLDDRETTGGAIIAR
ncbi:MAG TPA: M56 family metallopeptidase [Acidobacteriota bacterium]|nr:M56 family metallopeptidase [Acidobacteriota bacterium]